MKMKTVYFIMSGVLLVISLLCFLSFLGSVFHVYYGEAENAGFIISSTMLFISSVFLFLKGLKKE